MHHRTTGDTRQASSWIQRYPTLLNALLLQNNLPSPWNVAGSYVVLVRPLSNFPDLDSPFRRFEKSSIPSTWDLIPGNKGSSLNLTTATPLSINLHHIIPWHRKVHVPTAHPKLVYNFSLIHLHGSFADIALLPSVIRTSLNKLNLAIAALVQNGEKDAFPQGGGVGRRWSG